MIDDLRHFKANDPLGAFRLLSPTDAFLALLCGVVIGLIFAPYA